MNAVERLKEVVNGMTQDEVAIAQREFWRCAGVAAEKQGQKPEWFRTQFPGWWQAFDELPSAEGFSMINVICLEVSIDIIKKARCLPL